MAQETPAEERRRINAVAEQIATAAKAVSSTMGVGFLEKVYENALAYELRKAGLKVEQQFPITVKYEGQVVGEYSADLLVEGLVIVELKAAGGVENVHLAQCLNYLRATGKKLCLLMNFGKPRLESRRIVNGL